MEDVASYMGFAYATLLALRAALYAAHVLDMRDGNADWPIVGRCMDVVESLADLLSAKKPGR